ncbi:efflux RND transporter periplasmic adaptor subunit [Radicibacter daui]|uniref:efflux RND transporter periplasmic adaptor subunit n=1 Tax=Radicibacter daui TaxID=3064829 RepID=UPI004046942A
MTPNRKKRRLRPALIVAVLVIVAGAGVAGFTLLRPTPVAPPPTAAVTRGDIEDTVLATGTINASKTVLVGAQVSGQITHIDVSVGDEVKEGDPIAEIDPLTRENTLKDSEAALDNVKAQRAAEQATLRQAELAYNRQKQMRAQDATSREDFESAEATLAVTKANIAALDAQIRQAEVTVDTARVNLGYTKITAPMTGTIIAVSRQEGQTVNAAQSAPTIAKMADLSRMEVEAAISEADVVRVKPGQKVYFTILGDPDRRFYATLDSIKPVTDTVETTDDVTTITEDSKAVYYNGVFYVDNPDRTLRISMTAQVSIVLNEAKDALTVPVSALRNKARDGSYIVEVLQADGTTRPQKVHVGINNNVTAEVQDGLSEGDKVVLTTTTTTAAASASQAPRRMGPMRF